MCGYDKDDFNLTSHYITIIPAESGNSDLTGQSRFIVIQGFSHKCDTVNNI